MKEKISAVLRIIHQAKRCTFGKDKVEALEINMKDKIIDSWSPIDFKKKILEKQRSLDEVIELSQINEEILNQSAIMSSAGVSAASQISTTVNKINLQKRKFEKCQW